MRLDGQIAEVVAGQASVMSRSSFASVKAAWSHDDMPLSNTVWQPAHVFTSACWKVSGPGSTNAGPVEPPRKNNNKPTVNAKTQPVVKRRRAATPRMGRHRGTGRQQVPSGRGPRSHLPPASSERLHFQRSPPALIGSHSNVAWQRPLMSGPAWHGRPSVVQPHIHFWLGR